MAGPSLTLVGKSMSRRPTSPRPLSPARGDNHKPKVEPGSPTLSTTRGLASPKATGAGGGSDAEKRTALDAASRGDLELVSAYIPGHFREYEETARVALHRAANFGNLDVVVYLLEKAQVDRDAIDRVTGKAALHYACEKGRLDVIDYLVNVARVDLSAADKEGHNALDSAICFGQLDAARIIVRRIAEAAASKADEISKAALDAAVQERDLAGQEALKEKIAKEAAISVAEEESRWRGEVKLQLEAEVAKRQEAEARAQDMAQELNRLLLQGRDKADEERAAATTTTTVGPTAADATGEPTSLPVVEEIKAHLAKERRRCEDVEAERDALSAKLREAEAALAVALAVEVGRREQAEARQAELEAALEAANARATAAAAAAVAVVTPEVTTGFVQKQKHNSLARDTWESRFLVCREGKLRYYKSDKDYLVANPRDSKRSPRPGAGGGGASAAQAKVLDLKRCIAAPLPSDELVFVVRTNEVDEEVGEGSTGPTSPTTSLHPLWFRAPDAQARESWLEALEANGCTINEPGIIGSGSSSSGRPVSVRHASVDASSLRPANNSTSSSSS